MKLGCHCVLFGPKIITDTNTILSALHGAGATGVEIGARFLTPEHKETLETALHENNLVLSGYHVSALYSDIVEKWNVVNETILTAAQVLESMPNKNIIMSGLPSMDFKNFENTMDKRIEDPVFVRLVAEGLEKLAQTAKEKGVQLHYHNHSWEFKNDSLLLNTFGTYAPTLNFALDIGWASVSNANVPALLEKYANRVQYVHLRDHKKADLPAKKTFAALLNSYCELGQGDAFNWPELLTQIQNIVGEKGWAIIEYDAGEPDFIRYENALEFVQKTI